MKISKIYYSSYFTKKVKKLTPQEKELLFEFEKRFTNNCFDPRLKTHKLSGKLENTWSCSLSYKIRILFRFEKENEINFLDVGSHDIYK